MKIYIVREIIFLLQKYFLKKLFGKLISTKQFMWDVTSTFLQNSKI